MRLWITRSFRLTAVFAVVAIYVPGALTSSLVLAFTDSGRAHVLSEADNPAPPHTGEAASARQADGTRHEHHGRCVFCTSIPTAGARPGYAHGGEERFSAGEPGDPNKPFRVVEITMQEADGTMSYQPNAIEVKRGEQIKFIITNAGLLAHEFILASTADNLKHAELMKKYPDMEHDDPNGKTVRPGAKAEILWRFTKTGTFEFSCLIPGHREAGMVGTVTVK